MKTQLALCLTISAAALAGCATTTHEPAARGLASATKLRCKTLNFNEDKSAPEVQADGYYLKRFDLEPAETSGSFTMRNRTYYAKQSRDSKSGDEAESVDSQGFMYESPIGEGFKYSWKQFKVGNDGLLTLTTSDETFFFGTLVYRGVKYGFVTCSGYVEGEAAATAPAKPSAPAAKTGASCKTMDEARATLAEHSARIKAVGGVTTVMAVSGARTKTDPFVQANVKTEADKAKLEKKIGKTIGGCLFKVVAAGVIVQH